jgi:hypothetical protein
MQECKPEETSIKYFVSYICSGLIPEVVLIWMGCQMQFLSHLLWSSTKSHGHIWTRKMVSISTIHQSFINLWRSKVVNRWHPRLVDTKLLKFLDEKRYFFLVDLTQLFQLVWYKFSSALCILRFRHQRSTDVGPHYDLDIMHIKRNINWCKRGAENEALSMVH